MEETIWRIPIALLPVIPAAFALWRAFIRYPNSTMSSWQKMQLNAISPPVRPHDHICVWLSGERRISSTLVVTFIFPLMIAIWGIALTGDH